MTDSKFDRQIDRQTYPVIKWRQELLEEHFANRDALPFWVADMDFPAPEAVINSLTRRAQHGIYGYEYHTEAYFDALLNWYSERHNWTIDRDHIEFCPGVLNAVAVLINQHTDEGDGIILQPPVFFEFNAVIRSNNRQRVKNPLRLVDGRYEMDFEDLEAKAAIPENKILIICNPHNPVGRVWTADELQRAGDICARHGVLVISDEIHADIVYPPHRFTPIASLSDDLAKNSVTCLSPAKTFNIAGMIDAMTIIPDETRRQQFHDFAHRYQTNKTNVFAITAIETAYREGGAWLDEMLTYLQGNINFIRTYLAENLPQVRLIEPEGTFLIWLNFDEFGLDAKALEAFLGQEAGLALNSGYWFGREGAGYARMNIACPRSTLEDAFERLKTAFDRTL